MGSDSALRAEGRFSVTVARRLRISQRISAPSEGGLECALMSASGRGCRHGGATPASRVLPLRLALLQKGVDAFALILAVEQIDEALALQGQGGAARGALTRLMDQTLAESHGARA